MSVTFKIMGFAISRKIKSAAKKQKFVFDSFLSPYQLTNEKIFCST